MTDKGLTAEQVNALEFGLSLFEQEAKRTQKVGEWLMDSKDKEIESLKKKYIILNRYVNYVHEVIALGCVPRDFKYWNKFLFGKEGLQ
jgi:hypothetical protein